MNRHIFCFLAAIIALSVFSCKKTKKNNPTPVIDSPVVYDNYTKLTPGNYWIYQDYKIDSVGGAAYALGTFDSSYVEKDTTIGANTYHKYLDVTFASGGYNVSFLRDSLSYIINSTGQIIFSSADFTSTFQTFTYGPNVATPYTLTVTEQMGFKDVSISVDAGTFATSAFSEIFHYPSDYAFGTTREYDHRYCKNIGLISETSGFYDSAPYYYERRLVRYHVQ